ncbi:MAG: hypothetical protein JXR59_03850 [Desulfuromonadaceae bacterium]|nr:hypothetical protein [Desulfuromonadaceae bacterium]
MVVRGKKIQSLEPSAATREAVLKGALGPSGTLRAPTLRVGSDCLVGFDDQLYQDYLL